MKDIEPHVNSFEQVTVIGTNTVQSSLNRILCIFIANCGPITPTEVNSQSEFLAKYTNGGAISRRAHRSFFHALKHSQSMPLMCVRVTADKAIRGITNNGTPINTKGTKILNYKLASPQAFTLSEAQEGNGPKDWAIRIGDYIFAPDIAVGEAKFLELVSGMDNYVTVPVEPQYSSWSADGASVTISELEYFMKYIINYINDNMFAVASMTSNSTQVALATYIGYDPFTLASTFNSTTVTVNTASVNLETTNFIIAPTAPATTNVFAASISNIVTFVADSKNYYRFNLTVESKGNIDTYYLSTFPDDLDGNGSNMYLTSLNDLRDDLVIIPNDDNVVVSVISNVQFGATETVTTYDQNTIPMDLINGAISQVEEIEGIRISILSDCGICMPAYQKRLTILAESLKSIPVLSPPDNPNIPYVTNYVAGASIDTSYAWWGWPWCTDKSLLDFPVDLSAICYYIERVAANASGNKEFAPVFGKTTGVCSNKNIHSNPTKSQRLALQAYNINPIHYSKTDNIAYFTNDLTALSQLNVLQEEQTRRIINKIRYEVDLLCESYLSYDWSNDTCDLIKSAIKNYFINNILNLGRTIDGMPEIEVSLNGLNKVKVNVAVKPLGSVKFVTVYYNILSMAA